MLIDWFTVVAQIINFLILVWLLKRFLYQPILNAIDEREKKISDKVKDAKNIEKKAIELRDRFRDLIEKLEKHYDRKIQEAENKAKEKREELIEKVHQDIEQLKQQQRQNLEEEKDKIKELLLKRIKNAFFSLLQKAVNDLANEALEEEIVKIFLRRLKKETIEEKKRDSIKKVVLQTAFKLSKEQQKEIQQRINDLFEKEMEIQYRINSSLIGGIQLIFEDREISWSIDSYIASLENYLNERLTYER